MPGSVQIRLTPAPARQFAQVVALAFEIAEGLLELGKTIRVTLRNIVHEHIH